MRMTRALLMGNIQLSPGVKGCQRKDTHLCVLTIIIEILRMVEQE